MIFVNVIEMTGDPLFAIEGKLQTIHLADPQVKSGVTLVNAVNVRTPDEFRQAVSKYLTWRRTAQLDTNDRILLWPSAHGASKGAGIGHQNGSSIDYMKVFCDLAPQLDRQTAVFMSACWGGYPSAIAGAVNKRQRTPLLLCGPVVAVDVGDLDLAETAMLKLLVQSPTPSATEIAATLDKVNTPATAATYGVPFYRAWYWVDGTADVRRYPDNDGAKIRRR